MASKDRSDITVPLLRRNFVLSVINGALWMAGNRAADPGTVIPLLVLRLTGVEWAVGVATAVQDAAAVIIQVFAARLLDPLERKRPAYVWSTMARMIALVAAAGALLAGVGKNPWLVLCVVLSALFALMVSNGIAGLAWSDITARSVPSNRRGSLLTWRRVLGLGLSLAVSAPIVSYALGPRSPYPFPANYGMLFFVYAVLAGIGWVAFCLVTEPAPHAARRRLTWRQHFSRGLRILQRDETYRTFLWVRLLMGLAGAVPTFFMAFASRSLGLSEQWAAVFLTVRAVSEMVASIVFGRMSDRLGNRTVIIASTWVALGTFVAAGLAAWAGPATVPGWHGTSWAVLLLGASFAGLGLLAASREMGEFNYMLDLAPALKRGSYIGFANAFLLPLSLTPILAGWLAPRIGYGPLFAVAALLSAAAVVVATRLKEPRERLITDAEGAD